MRFALLLIATFIIPLSVFSQSEVQFPETITVYQADGTPLVLRSEDDLDEDGLSNGLEQNGYYWDNDLLKIVAWDGDPNQPYFITDPLQASTDQDPYSDYTEVSGVNLDVGVFAPEDHPLVAARPRIVVRMEEFEVIPLGTITDSRGGSQGSSYTNSTSNSSTWGVSVTQGVEYGTGGVKGSTSVTGSYSETTTTTTSSTSSSEINWQNARSLNPGEAAKLELIVYLENVGSTEALDIIPTVNLKIGDKIIATFNLPETESLTPKNTTGSRTTNFNVSQAGGQNILVTLDELKAIQRGAPFTLEVVQMQGNVETLDNDNNVVLKSWNQYLGDIDLVSVDIIAKFGDDEPRRHSVFAGWNRWDPEFNFQDVLGFIFNIDDSGAELVIENRPYPNGWYMSSPSQTVIDEWDAAGRPNDIMGLRMRPNTQIIMFGPDEADQPKVNLAIYSNLPEDTTAYGRILASITPSNLPISKVVAEVPVEGGMQSLTLSKNEHGFYQNEVAFEGIPAGNGMLIVTDASGSVTETVVSLPALYASANEVREYSVFLPNPGAEYWLFQDGDPDRPMLLYCLFRDEDGNELTTPVEYLTLPVDSANYAEKWAYTSHFRTYYNKVRIDPSTLILDANNIHFTETPVGSFGAALPAFGEIDIDYAYLESDTARAKINLHGTAFKLAPKPDILFPYDGLLNTVNISPDWKEASIWSVPLDTLPFSYDANGSLIFSQTGLQLIYDADFEWPVHDNFIDADAAFFNDTSTPVPADSGHINMGSSGTLELGSDYFQHMTVEAWVYPTANTLDSTFGGIIFNREGEYELARFTDGSIRWAISSNGDPGWNWIDTGIKVPLHRWTHLSLTIKEAADQFRKLVEITAIDEKGVQFNARHIIGSFYDFVETNDDFMIGARGNSNSVPFVFFEGYIDEVRFWNHARTETEIYEAFADTLSSEDYATADPGLIGYWRFDGLEDLGVGEPGVNDVRDLSINQNHGDVLGSVVLSPLATDIEAFDDSEIAKDFVLEQNYPNPFNPTTTITFQNQKTAEVKLTIYDLLGRRVTTLVDANMPAGRHQISWNGQDSESQTVASGIYLYRLEAGDFVQTRKMILLK